MGLDEALDAVHKAACRYAEETHRFGQTGVRGEMDASWERFEKAFDALAAAARSDRPLAHEAVAAMEAG